MKKKYRMHNTLYRFIYAVGIINCLDGLNDTIAIVFICGLIGVIIGSFRVE